MKTNSLTFLCLLSTNVPGGTEMILSFLALEASCLTTNTSRSLEGHLNPPCTSEYPSTPRRAAVTHTHRQPPVPLRSNPPGWRIKYMFTSMFVWHHQSPEINIPQRKNRTNGSSSPLVVRRICAAASSASSVRYLKGKVLIRNQRRRRSDQSAWFLLTPPIKHGLI